MNALLAAAGLLGFTSVALGAFGAHALDGRLSVEAKGWWETATLYALVHSAAVLAIAMSGANGTLKFAGWAFVAGTVIFAGSLYALALTGIRPLGAVTPIGGLAFLIGWGALVVAAWRA